MPSGYRSWRSRVPLQASKPSRVEAGSGAGPPPCGPGRAGQSRLSADPWLESSSLLTRLALNCLLGVYRPQPQRQQAPTRGSAGWERRPPTFACQAPSSWSWPQAPAPQGQARLGGRAAGAEPACVPSARSPATRGLAREGDGQVLQLLALLTPSPGHGGRREAGLTMADRSCRPSGTWQARRQDHRRSGAVLAPPHLPGPLVALLSWPRPEGALVACGGGPGNGTAQTGSGFAPPAAGWLAGSRQPDGHPGSAAPGPSHPSRPQPSIGWRRTRPRLGRCAARSHLPRARDLSRALDPGWHSGATAHICGLRRYRNRISARARRQRPAARVLVGSCSGPRPRRAARRAHRSRPSVRTALWLAGRCRPRGGTSV